jgi:hypothetical protein
MRVIGFDCIPAFRRDESRNDGEGKGLGRNLRCVESCKVEHA